MLKNLMRRIIEKRAIPISSEQLTSILKTASASSDIQDIAVAIDTEIKITGRAKKLLMTIPFEIRLIPDRAEKRQLYFTVSKFAPLNMNWIKKAVLQRPPHFTFDNDVVALDLNQIIPGVIKLPFGNIKEHFLGDSKLWIKLSL